MCSLLDVAAQTKRRVAPTPVLPVLPPRPPVSNTHENVQASVSLSRSHARAFHMPATRRGTQAGDVPPPPAPGDLAAAATAAATKAIAAANAAQRAALRAASAAAARTKAAGGAATRSPSPSLGCAEGGVAYDRHTSAAPSSPGSAAPPPASPPPDAADAAAAAAAAVSARYPGREAQVRALSGALGLPSDWPRHVLVHGPPSVGKTAVVRCDG